MSVVHRCQLIDDDGAFVLSTESNLRASCPAAFDYQFPGVLLDGLRAGRLVAWQVSMESISDFEVFSLKAGKPFRRAMLLQVPDKDRCLLLPWAAVTMAFDGRGGTVERLPGLVAEFRLPSGWYEVDVGEPREARAGSDADLRWSIAMRRREPPTKSELTKQVIPRIEVPEP